ncbi:MAG: FtsX-like permease family protein [Acidobacteria bacterium]|nr:FtsX-like permease family protein [Acidobacteriota bacterium]
MSYWSRLVNVFRDERLRREIAEELESHIEEAVDRGRDREEARRALGPSLRLREESRDVRLLPWLDSLRADAVFGWRQISKHKATSAAVVLSLGLAIGSCLAAFQLVDALLLRPLPIAHADRLYVIEHETLNSQGRPETGDASEYPVFEQMREAVDGDAELLAISYASRADITFGSDEDVEKAYRQWVSGAMFETFGLRPAAGRLLARHEDAKPGASPYVVLSYDYWKSRFGGDPQVIGRTMRMEGQSYEVIGVVESGFTGVEPGVFVDFFAPVMMNPNVERKAVRWFRAFAALREGVAPEAVRVRLDGVHQAMLQERVVGLRAEGRLPSHHIDRLLRDRVLLESASSGTSRTQRSYREALFVISALAGLALLVGCANVANLMAAQGVARSREMALRVSIGAGRRRLIQLVMVESGWLALLATAVGAVFAAWAAPQVVGLINPPDNPARLALPLAGRPALFGLGLALTVTGLFGLIPALRASSVRPAAALKGGAGRPSKGRLMYGLIAAQVAFCFVVTLAAGLFVGSLNGLADQPLGFEAERLAVVDMAARSPTVPEAWEQVAESLRAVPGVESVALASWALMDSTAWTGAVWIGNEPAEDFPFFLGISPGWLETMAIRRLQGRDLRRGDANAALVNESFARAYFDGADPVGQWFERTALGGARERVQIVGLVADARYNSLKESIRPTIYLPFLPESAEGRLTPKSGAFMVRTSGDPTVLMAALREAGSRPRPELRVANVRLQQEILRGHTIRERLLALLGLFFAGVALLLAGLGLYGTLTYSVVQRRREIGIRRAVGAQAEDVAWSVAAGAAGTAVLGAAGGLALSLASAGSIEALLFGVKATDAAILAPTALAVVAVALLAAAPSVIRAIRIDPAEILRAE